MRILSKIRVGSLRIRMADLLSILFTPVLAVLFCLLSNVRLHGQTENSRILKPNILFIMVDDLRPELGCYNQSYIISPNIDRLARMGQLFTNAYVNYPVCGPSRATLLSGLYASRTRFLSWNCSQDEDVHGIVSLPMHFKNHHYKTVSLGKVYNNFEDGKGSWDEVWRPAVTTAVWDYQTRDGIKVFEDLNAEREQDIEVRNNSNLPRRGLAYEQADVPDVAYMDGRIASEAIERLQEFKTNSQSFFLAVGFQKPHLPFNAPRKYWDMYDEKKIRMPRNADRPRDAPDASMHNYSELRAYYGIPKTDPISDSLGVKLIHGYYACVSYVDSQIGRVLNELENLGLDDNTIVVLWGDHGWQLGEHGLWCKHANYRTSLQIPLIFKVPYKSGGIQQTALVESVDIFPTLCDLAGLSKPFHLQGKSFAPLLDNPQMGGKDAIFSRSPLAGETIITRTHSYTEFFDSVGKVRTMMLYDLTVDSQENINVAGRPENKQLIKNLGERLHRHISERDIISLR